MATPEVGTFTYAVSENRWTWSDEIYRMHGYEPGQVVPTQEMILAHVHPDDVEAVRKALVECLTLGFTLVSYHRIFDSDRGLRHLLVVGTASWGSSGAPTALHGHIVDLTQVRRRENDHAVTEALADVLESRAVIEQAKGVLMFGLAISENEAFALLARLSQSSNIKLRRLAERVVGDLPNLPGEVSDTHERLVKLLGGELHQALRRAISESTTPSG